MGLDKVKVCSRSEKNNTEFWSKGKLAYRKKT